MLGHIINGLVNGSTYVLVASGLTLIFGILDVVNLAHGEVYMFGAVCSFMTCVSMGMNFWVSLLISMVVVGLIGILIEKVFFKRVRNAPHITMMIMSVGMSVLFQNIVQLFFGSEPKAIKTSMSSQVIRVFGTSITVQRLLIIVVGMGLMIGLNLLINKTTIGKTMRATAQDRDAAMLMGININYIYAITFFIGCAMAAAAGTLIAPILLVFPAMGATSFIKAFTVVALGGLGNVVGTIYAGLFIGIVESLGAVYISTTYKDSFAFIILILVLLFKPSGLMGGKR